MLGVVRVIGVTVLAACCSGSQDGADREPERPSPRPVAADAGAAAPVLPDSPCAADADCAVVQKGEDCCDICGWRAFTKAGLAALERYCAGRTPSCPAIDCPYQARHAACEQGRCTAVPDAVPDAGACRPVRDDERDAIATAERFLREGGVLRGSPAPSAAPPPRGRGIQLEEIAADRESLEPHAWGIARPTAPDGRFLVVFRYDADWLSHVYPRGEAPAHQARAGQAVAIAPGQPPSRIHQDILLDHVEHVCPTR